MKDAFDQRAREVEDNVLAQLGRLSDLVVGTTGGVRRAGTALGFLVLGLGFQLGAALAGLPPS